MEKAGITLIPDVPTEVIASLMPSQHAAINSTQLCIQWLNELVSQLPARYHWRFRTAEAFKAEFGELVAKAADMAPLNRLYWEDALKNCEAYSVMVTWRIVELARSCVWAIARGDLLCAAIMARSALESTTQYVDASRTITATLDQVRGVNFRKDAITSRDLEDFLLKTVFAARRPDDDEIYKPTNILTIVSRIAKSPGQENILPFYEVLCEVAHPNFLGRSVHILEVVPGSRKGDEVRILGPGQTAQSTVIMEAMVGALSWACGTHVSAFGLMRSTIKDFLERLNSKTKDQHKNRL